MHDVASGDVVEPEVSIHMLGFLGAVTSHPIIRHCYSGSYAFRVSTQCSQLAFQIGVPPSSPGFLIALELSPHPLNFRLFQEPG